MSARPLDLAINDLLHFTGVKRLADVIVGAESQRLLGRFERTKASEHDDRKMRIDLADLTQPFNAADSGHPNVHDNGVGMFFFEEFEASLNAIGGVDPIIWFQEHAQAFTRPHFIVDNEDLGKFRRGDHGASAARESRRMPRTRRSRKKNGTTS